MVKLLYIFILLACLSVFCATKRVKFTGYQSNRFIPKSEEELQTLKSLEAKNPGVIFMRHPGRLGSPVDIMSPPHLQDVVEGLKSEMESETLMEDVETTIMENEAKHAQIEAENEGSFAFNSYWKYEKVQEFLEKMAAENPDLCTLETYGKSFEGRPLRGMVISTGRTAGNKTKAMAFVDGGNHAREWITVSSCCFLIEQLVDKKSHLHKILKTYDATLCCLTNPDGYVYAWEKNRMWRKTRTINKNKLCPGVDPNRNWSYGFGKSGASNDPCSETYHGEKAYSIEETRSLRDYMKQKNALTYSSFHS